MSDQRDRASPAGPTLWGIDPDRAAEWVRDVLVALVFALPFAILVLILWRLVLDYLPGFEWAGIYPAVLLAVVGVAGYWKHRNDQRNGLRVALRSELELADRRPRIEPRVLEASIDRLHLLSDPEIDALVTYYGIAGDPDAGEAAVEEARDRARAAIEDRLEAEVDRGAAT